MLDDMKELDVLAAWRPEELFFKRELRHCYRIRLGELGPIDQDGNWSAALAGKRVLAVHPFAETIESQYAAHREKLFRHKDVLPAMKSLETVRAVQSIAGNHAGFHSWFDALDSMKAEIERHEFDIALLGCGAYGFPLAAHIKRMGKKAVHIGGPMQLYFGIKGKRWDHSGLYNDCWVSPADSERPKNLHNVENGCYW